MKIQAREIRQKNEEMKRIGREERNKKEGNKKFPPSIDEMCIIRYYITQKKPKLLHQKTFQIK